MIQRRGCRMASRLALRGLGTALESVRGVRAGGLWHFDEAGWIVVLGLRTGEYRLIKRVWQRGTASQYPPPAARGVPDHHPAIVGVQIQDHIVNRDYLEESQVPGGIAAGVGDAGRGAGHALHRRIE